MMAITKTKIAVSLLLLGLMLNIAHPMFDIQDVKTLFYDSAPTTCDAEPSQLHWLGLAWLALAIGVAFNAAVSVLGGVLGGTKYSNFLKGGLWAIVETAALLAIFSGAFIELHEYGVANIDTARAYSTVIRNTVTYDFTLLMIGSTVLSFMSRQAPNIRRAGFQAMPISFQFAPMFRPIFDGLGTLTQLLAAAVAEWIAHEFVFCFIKTSLLSTLLPIGFFLRAFGLRAGGNALIGISLSLYFVYPFMMIQVGEMLNNYFSRTNEALDPLTFPPFCAGNKPICCMSMEGTVAPAPGSQQYIKNGLGWETDVNQRLNQSMVLKGDFALTISTSMIPIASKGTFCMYNTGVARAYGSLMSFLPGIWAPVAGVAGAIVSNLIFLKWTTLSWIIIVIYPLFGAFLLHSAYDVVFFVFIVSLVMPILMIFITITLAKEIAKALGTEIDLSALEKLI